jgi:serine/threonine-protein kinase
VVHRDIKPDNIFLARVADMASPVPKVLDFGISKVDARNGTEQLTLTRDGTTVGTPSYMSYEQLTGERAIDGRADVYGFGVILYEALTGRVPFEADSFPELMVRFATTVPVEPKALRPEIPGTLSRLMLWALKRERDERISTIDTLIRELEPFTTRHGFAAELTALSPNVTPEPPRPVTAWREHSEGSVRGSVPAHHMTSSRQAAAVRSRTPLAAAALALLVLGAASVFYFTHSSEPPAETSVSAATHASEPAAPIAAPPPAAAVHHVTPERPQPRPTTANTEEATRPEPTAPVTAGSLPRIVETPNRSRQSAVQPARPARPTGPKPRDLGIY